jgi:hypothetical protein
MEIMLVLLSVTQCQPLNRWADFLPYSTFISLSFRVRGQFQLSATLIHNDAYFIECFHVYHKPSI